VGDAYDNAAAETVMGLFKNEAVPKDSPFRTGALNTETEVMELTPAVRVQLLQVSGATIDRLLKPTKDADRPKGISATRAGPLLRNSITVRKAGDEHEQAPGFIEADLVVHCGPTLAGEGMWT